MSKANAAQAATQNEDGASVRDEKIAEILRDGISLASEALKIGFENDIIAFLKDRLISPQPNEAQGAARLAESILASENFTDLTPESWKAISAIVLPRITRRHEASSDIRDDTDVQEYLERIQSTTAQLDNLNATRDAVVHSARDLGATWDEIAMASGISRQSAHQRWSEHGNARHRERRQRKRPTAQG